MYMYIVYVTYTIVYRVKSSKFWNVTQESPVFIILSYFKTGGSFHEGFLDSSRPSCFIN